MTWFIVLFVALLVITFFWLIYMAICHPKTLIELMKADQERRQQEHERKKERRAQMGKAASVAAGILAKILKK